MSLHHTNRRDHKLLRLANSIIAAWLILALTAPSAWGQIEETRLTQPTLDPVPPPPSEVQEEPRPEPPADRANILGMTVVASDVHRALVIDVGMMSPAEEAGIREGDEIISFAGFRGKDYEEWLEGVRRIVRDTPGGIMLPMVVARDGEEGVVQIRTLVARADPQPLARPPRLVEPAGPGVAHPYPAYPAPSRQPGAVIDERRFFGQAFVNDVVGRPTERAIAHLHRLGVQPPPAAQREELGDADQAVPPDGVTPEHVDDFAQFEQRHAPPLIGLAGFQNRPQGLAVTVDVGSLPPGNYLVAIADPDAVMGGIGNFGIDADAVRGAEPAERQPRSPANGRIEPSERNFQPFEGQPPDRPDGIDRQQQERLGQPLRQQVDEDAAADAAETGTTAPATGEVNQLSAPATGEVNPLSATPTGQPDPRAGQQDAGIDAQAAAPQPTGFDPLVTAGLGAPVGMLPVDQSGTGHLQQIVEGVQVADVVGQAIVIYAQAEQQPAVPPGGDVTDAARPGQVQDAQRQHAVADIPPTTAPVAAGLIQYLSARGLPGAAGATGLPVDAPLQTEPGVQQPPQPAAEQQPDVQQQQPAPEAPQQPETR